jgi:sugar/nucleoside kinase (ribokinase family)
MPDTAISRRSGHPVVFVGAATIDSIALVGSFPAPDQRVVAEDLVFAGGGPAATAAVAAARLGVPAAFVGTVGDDADGERIIEGLVAEGIDVSGVTRAAGARSAASVIVVDRARGTRAICARPGPDVDISRGANLIDSAEWVHADHLGWSAVSHLVAPTATRRPKLSIDGGNAIPGFTPAGVDLYVPTVEALQRVYGEATPDGLLDAAMRDGARRVVATAGAGGSYAVDSAGERAYAPARQVRVLSTLGAGDVFHGALVAAHTRDLPLGHALEYANTVAALSCLGLDGRSAIPTHDQVDAHLRARTA